MTNLKKYDLIVAGGGPAGMASAVAASRRKAKTLLIERYGFLGGEGATQLAIFGFFDKQKKRVLKGIPEEFVTLLKKIGGTTGHVMVDGAHFSSFTGTDMEMFKYAAMEMVLDSGADILLHSVISDAVVDNNKITGVTVVNKSGVNIIKANYYIDATGDGDLARFSGVPYEKGRKKDGLMQAMSLRFRLGRVDLEKVEKLWNEGAARCKKPGEDKETFLRGGGTLGPYEKYANKIKLFPRANRKFWLFSMHDNEVSFNVTSVIKKDATDAYELTEAEIEARRHIMKIVDFLKKYVPGFEKTYIIDIAPHIGVRETRRIKGEYTLTDEDVLQGRDFNDSIARSGFPTDLHDPEGKGLETEPIINGGSYGIPYRILVPITIDNLLVAGRCVSATHKAISSLRVMGSCMAMGQAAGTSIALCIEGDVIPRLLNTKLLREELKKDEVIL